MFSGVVVVSRPKCAQLVNFRPTHYSTMLECNWISFDVEGNKDVPLHLTLAAIGYNACDNGVSYDNTLLIGREITSQS